MRVGLQYLVILYYRLFNEKIDCQGLVAIVRIDDLEAASDNYDCQEMAHQHKFVHVVTKDQELSCMLGGSHYP